MKKMFLYLAIIFCLMSAPISFAAGNPMQNLSGVGAKDTPTSYQTVIDYVDRVDAQPVYLGYSLIGKAASEDSWLIYYFTYDVEDRFLTKKTAFGSWDNRALLTYQ